MELSERSSAISMVQKARKNGLPFWKKDQRSDSDHVVVAFEAFQQLSQITVRFMTSISSMVNMHEDICSTADGKRAAIIILPFYKNQRVYGSFETTRSYFRCVNRRVLKHAPCSVGILVDRGLGGTTNVSASNVSFLITVLFFGGSDDCEALAYGIRMAEHPGISLNIIRIVVEPETIGEISTIDMQENNSIKKMSSAEEFLSQFGKILEDNSVQFEEKAIRNVTETIDAIREAGQCNLFLVGRMPEGERALALWRKSECPELGPVGSLLISPDLSITASVLVIQQYNGYMPLYLGQDMEEYHLNTWGSRRGAPVNKIPWGWMGISLTIPSTWFQREEDAEISARNKSKKVVSVTPEIDASPADSKRKQKDKGAKFSKTFKCITPLESSKGGVALNTGNYEALATLTIGKALGVEFKETYKEVVIRLEELEAETRSRGIQV
ncbi:cation/H(+) antiporter 18-like [Hibiscus syriacus]|uniref:cation/H(+) antiporter 18-like n=1 Tax=Hibiscus syriacus TaxID=106335 RepID=UPI00192101BF|nr:cation/H(+) antiporter 18-like [Hibiscus syriacus]